MISFLSSYPSLTRHLALPQKYFLPCIIYVDWFPYICQKKCDKQTSKKKLRYLNNVCSLARLYLFRHYSFYAVIIFNKLNSDKTKLCVAYRNVVKRSTIVVVVFIRGLLKRRIDKQHIQTCDIFLYVLSFRMYIRIFTIRILAFMVAPIWLHGNLNV